MQDLLKLGSPWVSAARLPLSAWPAAETAHLPMPVMAPNMRLKLAGGDRSKGNGALCAGAHELSFNHGALAGESPAA